MAAFWLAFWLPVTRSAHADLRVAFVQVSRQFSCLMEQFTVGVVEMLNRRVLNGLHSFETLSLVPGEFEDSDRTKCPTVKHFDVRHSLLGYMSNCLPIN